MAHKRTGGTTRNGRDSKSKTLGLKAYKNNTAHPGFVLIRQRGTKYHPGRGTALGKDHTIHAVVHGLILFKARPNKTTVSVKPTSTANGSRNRTCAF
ncbi:MAG: 50S ribosomal protein L27 [Candidatus Hodgkinia cicadicola]|nr:MAG: 50S ribosomal protein L27 [Candidatus Hodgkinia cicadicola]